MRCHSQLSNFQIPIEVSALPPTSPDGAWMQPLMWRKDVLTISQINVYGPFSVGDRRWNKQRSCLRLQTRTQQLVSPSSWWFLYQICLSILIIVLITKSGPSDTHKRPTVYLQTESTRCRFQIRPGRLAIYIIGSCRTNDLRRQKHVWTTIADKSI